MKGIFISAEGTDGAGKSTQLKLINDYLKLKNIDALFIREPGGTPVGEEIRSVILDVKNTGMSCHTEALLYAACRAQLAEQVIIPALEEGRTVVCDRYIDSSIAYQGYGRELGEEYINNINSFAVNCCMPDLTLFFDLPPKLGILRKKSQQALDRMEAESAAFHNRVYEGYKILAEKYPHRIKTIDASLNPQEVFGAVKKRIRQFF